MRRCVLRRPPIEQSRYATHSDRSISIRRPSAAPAPRVVFLFGDQLPFNEKFCLPREHINATTHKLFEFTSERRNGDKSRLRKPHR